MRDRIRDRAQRVCEAAGIEIEHVNKSHIRKEDLVARVLAFRGAGRLPFGDRILSVQELMQWLLGGVRPAALAMEAAA